MNKFLSGFLVIIIISTALVFINSYLLANSYHELANKYPIKIKANTTKLQINSLSVNKVNTSEKPIGLRDKMELTLFNDTITFSPKGLYSLLFPGFQFKSDDIHSCSKQCGGSSAYILIIDSIGIQLRMKNVPQLLDWCWENKLPILSSKDRRSWLYDSKKLPNKNTSLNQLSTYENYMNQAKQSCIGY